MADGTITDTADSLSDQSATVEPDASPEHEVDQSATLADEPAPAGHDYLVEPPTPPDQAFPQPSAPEPAPIQTPNPASQEGKIMVQWLGVAGQPHDRTEMRLADNPDKVYHPGDEVPLSPDQIDSLRRSGGHIFAGDPELATAPGG